MQTRHRGGRATLRTLMAGILLLPWLAFSMPAGAAAEVALAAEQIRTQPAQSDGHNISPLWREVRRGEAGRTTIKTVDAGVLIQMEGNAWRHNSNKLPSSDPAVPGANLA